MAGEGECMGCSLGDKPLNFDELSQLYEDLEGWKLVCGRAYNSKGIKEKFSVFLLLM